jgi:23S rRNA (pseudouridine1915-N3)-methyltransferase
VRVRLIAVGSRMPKWVREAYEDYITRLSSGLKVSLVEIEPGQRSGRDAGGTRPSKISARPAQMRGPRDGAEGDGATKPQSRAMQAEGQKLLAALRKDEYVVALDEHGSEMTTRELAAWLKARMQDGRDIAFLVGGPDGFAREVLERSDLKWSLSRLTFPHALVRVVLAEQLYRAHGVLSNHPYHRD